jgi:hypothetical protein
VRIICAIALVAIVVASTQAQAPTPEQLSRPVPEIKEHMVGGRLAGYDIVFADGSILRADNMTMVSSRDQENGEEARRTLPRPVDFDLSGHVRLTMPSRSR